MKYAIITLLFLVAVYFFTVLNYVDNGWQFVQPFLIVLLLLYLNLKDIWLVYIFAFVAGIFVDSFTGIFGLHTIIFLSIVFILRILQYTIFHHRNILSVLTLTIFSFVFFWLLFWLLNLIFNWQLYTFTNVIFWDILKTTLVNIVVVIFFHVLYYNIYLKKHERQSF